MKSLVENATILITGANGGIGLETVKALLIKKPKTIILACRTLEKAENALLQLPKSETEIIPMGGFDMTDKTSIRNAINEIPSDLIIDILFLQSGGMVVSKHFEYINVSNNMRIEKTIYQNTIGGYLTYKVLSENKKLNSNARIVLAGGEGARGIKGMINQPHFSSKEEFINRVLKPNGNYSDIDALGVSKFTSALLTQKLSSLNLGHEFLWFSPGLTAGTNGLRDVSSLKKIIMEKIAFPLAQILGFAQSPQQAAHKNAKALDGVYGSNGDVLGAPDAKTLGKIVDQKPMNPSLTNSLFIDSFWKEIILKA